jgi:hypothetical protein
LKNPSQSPDEISPEIIKIPSNDSTLPLDDQQQELLRRCLTMMKPSVPPLSKLTVPETEVKKI